MLQVFEYQYNIILYNVTITRIHNATWTTLKKLIDSPLSKVLDDSLRNDFLYPILSSDHLRAIDRRHATILEEIEAHLNSFSFYLQVFVCILRLA